MRRPPALFAAFLALALGPSMVRAAAADPASVLILVNDATPPETGTGGKSASVFVGEYYAKARGIPTANIVHLNTPMESPQSWDAWNITWTLFDSTIRQPVKQFLSSKGLMAKILYIVTTYGVPVRIVSGKDRPTLPDGLSIDSFLAAMNSGSDNPLVANPYLAGVAEGEHFRNWTNPRGWKMYLVTRLDGPSASIATGLVDKAIHAEANLKPSDGIAYFDWRHITDPKDPYYPGDASVVNANKIAQAKGFKTVFNDNQNNITKMIHSAPNALWAWGWYSSADTWDGYQFAEGAVGAQFTSYTANSIRTMALPGTWVPLWLKAGITATWGATGEPYTVTYALGDNLLNHFWSGYNFAESAYLASPYLNFMMVFLGDPLYSPKAFQPAKMALAAQPVTNLADGTATLSPGSMATVWGSDLSLCTATNRAASLPDSLCSTQVLINGKPAPLFYVSPTQINLMLPRDLPAGQDAQLTVTRDDGDTAQFTLPAARVRDVSPGVFLYLLDGVVRAVVQNSDYSTNGPLSAGQGLRPLKRGEAAVLYGDGLGPTDSPASVTDAPSAKGTLIRATAAVEVFVNGAPQHPFFAGLTPGLVGVFQVNFILDPATPLSGNDQDAVWLNVNGVESPKVHISLQL